MNYQAPAVEVLDVLVEAGFTLSTTNSTIENFQKEEASEDFWS